LSSPRAEILSFYLPLLFSIPFVLFLQLPQAKGSAILSFLILQGLGVGPFHLGTTWFHATDHNIRNYFFGSLRKASIFLLSATLIVCFSVTGMIFFQPIVQGIYLLWTVQHLTQQNVGILLLHHNGNSNEVVVERKLEVRTLHAAAWFFSLCFISKFAPAHSITQVFCVLVLIAALVDLGDSLVRYIGELKDQLRAGKRLNLSAQSFWLLSVLFLVPLAIGRDFNEALLIPLVLHWFQYIGLNLSIIKKKYQGTNRKMLILNLHPLLQFVVIGTLFTLLFLTVGVCASLQCHGWQKDALFGLVLSLGMIHYLHDAFLWRFREPFLRRELLTYIKGSSPVTSRVVSRTQQNEESKMLVRR
jgi:hypothetical protein